MRSSTPSDDPMPCPSCGWTLCFEGATNYTRCCDACTKGHEDSTYERYYPITPKENKR